MSCGGRSLLAFAVCSVIAVSGCGASAPRAEPKKSLQLNAPGAAVDVAGALVTDYVTVIDFWSESCGACAVLGGMLAAQVANEPRIVIRLIDVGDGLTQVARSNGINALPHFNIYDRRRRLRYELVGNDCLRAPELAKQLASEP